MFNKHAGSYYRRGYICLLCCILVLFTFFSAAAQEKNQYPLQYRFVDTVAEPAVFGLQTVFENKLTCNNYLFQLLSVLQKKGFITASVDSISLDSASATTVVFLGRQYRWAKLSTSSVPTEILNAAGFRNKNFTNQPLDFSSIDNLQKRMLDKMENSGYPFAKIYLDSFQFKEDGVHALLKVEKGPLYKIDSIRLFGDARISNRFLQRYLEIPEPSLYQKQKLLGISNRLLQLPYLQEEKKWDVTFLGAGSTLNLYLKNKKSSQINGIIGFLPSNEQLGGNKLLVTGDFNLNLKNNFGFGESLSIIFQQIQVKSPRLQLQYQQPFLFGSPFGIDIGFDGFKKDSSFLNINLQLGLQYSFGGNRSAKIFLQQFITNLDFIDSNAIRLNKRLPDQVDQTTTNIGLDYEWFNTDYRFNPRKGYDVKLTGSAGLRRIRPNNTIVNIKDVSNPSFSYQSLYDSAGKRAYTFRFRLNIARFFKTGKQTAVKTAINAGWMQSPRIFRNELFQIGGFKQLRGFDEESIFASSYAILTAEYRVLLDLNSYLYAFTDGAWVRNKSQFANLTNNFLGAGFGMAFQTKAGIFNIAFAAGKRGDLPLNLRQSKIHFGYVNFF